MRGFLEAAMKRRDQEHEKMMASLTPKEMTALSAPRNGRSGKKVGIDVEQSIRDLRAKEPAATIVDIARRHHVSVPVVRRVLGLKEAS